MLDIKFIRENKDLIAEAARKKRLGFKIDELLKADDERVKIVGLVDNLRREQNEASAGISQASGDEKAKLIEKMSSVKTDLQKGEEELKEVMKTWQRLMLEVPNIPDMSVPEGDDDSGNQEVKVWGERRKFDFIPKSQVDLMTALKLVDFERGAKVAGFRGYFLKNEAAELSMALWQYAMQVAIADGYTPIIPPIIDRPEMFMGTGYLPQGEEDLYKTQDGDYLAGTAEVPTMGYYFDEVIPREHLPVKFVAFSPCYRREAGSHGKDTRGLIRLHEFYKVEQVVICEADHEQSVKYHEEILANAEKIMQGLEIPYHVVVNCTGDLGQGQVKKYDIEAWVPSENKYRETHSISYFHDFQTRRSNIKYKDTDGKMRLTHSLNGTALASPRILVPLFENYQQADGSILIPKVLQPFMGGREIIK
ncbi:MAG: serine--tRNA ligase [Candidatus Paceibacterota bacterium]|jgi:seryl-tRNA synthetase